MKFLKFHFRIIFDFYRWIILKTDKKLFAWLFNIKSILIRSNARLKWKKKYFILTDKSFPSFSHTIRHQVQCNDAYEFGIQRRIDNLAQSYFLKEIDFRDGDKFIDCGANVGDLKLWFDFNKIDIEYIGFEPYPLEYDCLLRNTSPSRVHNLALHDESTTVDFYISSQEANSSIIKPEFYDEIVSINAIRLEDFVNTKIKCLKLEAEGSEPEVLNGLGKKLSMIEYISADLDFERGQSNESTLVPTINFLLENNFQLINISHDRVCALFKNNNSKNLS